MLSYYERRIGLLIPADKIVDHLCLQAGRGQRTMVTQGWVCGSGWTLALISSCVQENDKLPATFGISTVYWNLLFTKVTATIEMEDPREGDLVSYALCRAALYLPCLAWRASKLALRIEESTQTT